MLVQLYSNDSSHVKSQPSNDIGEGVSQVAHGRAPTPSSFEQNHTRVKTLPSLVYYVRGRQQ